MSKEEGATTDDSDGTSLRRVDGGGALGGSHESDWEYRISMCDLCGTRRRRKRGRAERQGMAMDGCPSLHLGAAAL